MMPFKATDLALMELALQQAERAEQRGEVPIGAVIADAHGRVIAAAHNRQLALRDPTSHAEVEAIRSATKNLGERYLTGCTIVVTLEPCTMCAGAIAHARIPRVIFAAWDEKAGAVGSVYDVLRDNRLPHPKPEVVAGVHEAHAQELLRQFFVPKRD